MQVKGNVAPPVQAATVCSVAAQPVDETKPCVQAVDLTEDDAPASKRQRVCFSLGVVRRSDASHGSCLQC